MQTLSVQFDNSMNRTQQTHHCNCLFELLSFVHLFCDETFSFLSVSVQGDSFLVCRKWRNTFPVNIDISHFTKVWVEEEEEIPDVAGCPQLWPVAARSAMLMFAALIASWEAVIHMMRIYSRAQQQPELLW